MTAKVVEFVGREVAANMVRVANARLAREQQLCVCDDCFRPMNRSQAYYERLGATARPLCWECTRQRERDRQEKMIC